MRLCSRPKKCGEAAFAVGEGQAEEGGLRNVDALRAVGEVEPVDQHQADDFAEGQRHDGEIVAAQPQHRKAQDDAPQGGQNAGQRQRDVEGPGHDAVAEPAGEIDGGQQRIGIGADGIEGDVAEVEQPGEADHDVEAPAQHDVGEDVDCQVDRRACRRPAGTAAGWPSTTMTGEHIGRHGIGPAGLGGRVPRLWPATMRLRRRGSRRRGASAGGQPARAP